MLCFAVMCSTCDVVTVNCPLHEGTRGMFNKEMIAKMKPGSYLVRCFMQNNHYVDTFACSTSSQDEAQLLPTGVLLCLARALSRARLETTVSIPLSAALSPHKMQTADIPSAACRSTQPVAQSVTLTRSKRCVTCKCSWVTKCTQYTHSVTQHMVHSAGHHTATEYTFCTFCNVWTPVPRRRLKAGTWPAMQVCRCCNLLHLCLQPAQMKLDEFVA